MTIFSIKKINVYDDDAADASGSYYYNYTNVICIITTQLTNCQRHNAIASPRSVQEVPSDHKQPEDSPKEAPKFRSKQSKEIPIPNNVSQEDPDLSLIFESSIFTVTKAKKTKNLRSFTRSS